MAAGPGCWGAGGLKQARGRPAADPRDAHIARLTREKAKLEQELATSRFVVEVQAKLGALLEKLSESADNEPGPDAVTCEAITALCGFEWAQRRSNL